MFSRAKCHHLQEELFALCNLKQINDEIRDSMINLSFSDKRKTK